MKPLFADTHIVLAAGECHQKGYDVFRENPCDDLRRPHCYSRLWFAIGSIGLSPVHTNVIGGLLISTFLLLSVFIVRPQNGKEFILFSILLFSPSIMLGVERANMDLLIFSLLILCSYLLLSKKKMLRTLSFPLLLLMALLKFYPVVSFGIFIHYLKKAKTFWLLMLIVLIVFGSFLILTYQDLLQLRNNIPRPNGWLSFGAASLLSTIAPGRFASVATFFMICFSLLLAFILSARTKISNPKKDSLNFTLFIFGSYNLFFCFFMNTNYDYRTVFFILVMPYLFDLRRLRQTPIITQNIIVLFFGFLALTVWFNFARLALEFIGKNPGINDLTEKLIWTFFILKQLGSWGSITLLMALNIELARKPLRDKFFNLNGFRLFQNSC